MKPEQQGNTGQGSNDIGNTNDDSRSANGGRPLTSECFSLLNSAMLNMAPLKPPPLGSRGHCTREKLKEIIQKTLEIVDDDDFLFDDIPSKCSPRSSPKRKRSPGQGQ